MQDGPLWDDDDAPARHAAPTRRTLPDLVAEAVWTYRAAPLATRVTIDVVVVAVLMVVAVGGAWLVLRDPDGPDLASASASTSTAWSSTTVAPTTTTSTTVPPAPPTTPAPTTTTVRPTTTTVPPAAPPPTEAPPVTDAPAPPPDTGRRPYRSCVDALMDGALPLHRGEPGYGEQLDRDGDGEACEWDDGHRD